MKKIIAVILCTLIVLSLCGWTNIHTENVNIHIYVDDETGVEYNVYVGYGRGGICPRYNADGTLMIREE